MPDPPTRGTGPDAETRAPPSEPNDLRRPGGFCETTRPDPIPNSAVKRPSAHGTVSQDPGESVAARPAKIASIHSKRYTNSKTAPRNTSAGPSRVSAGRSALANGPVPTRDAELRHPFPSEPARTGRVAQPTLWATRSHEAADRSEPCHRTVMAGPADGGAGATISPARGLAHPRREGSLPMTVACASVPAGPASALPRFGRGARALMRGVEAA